MTKFQMILVTFILVVAFLTVMFGIKVLFDGFGLVQRTVEVLS